MFCDPVPFDTVASQIEAAQRTGEALNAALYGAWRDYAGSSNPALCLGELPKKAAVATDR